MKRKMEIPTSDLKEGMILGEDIIVNNVIHISAGHIIGRRTIEKLENIVKGKKIVVEIEEKNKVMDLIEETSEKIESIAVELKEVIESIESEPHKCLPRLMDLGRKVQDMSFDLKLFFQYAPTKDSSGLDFYRHMVQVAILSVNLARISRFSEEELFDIALAGLLHDMGKVTVPDEILLKKGKLDEEEFELIKKHCFDGYLKLSDIPLPAGVKRGIFEHHEKIDGSGYPRNLKEEEIHEYAKIIAVADIFDALTSDRSYRNRNNPFEAFEIMIREFATKLDYKYLGDFIENMAYLYIGNDIEFNEKVATVIRINPKDITRPLVCVEGDFIDLYYERAL